MRGTPLGPRLRPRPRLEGGISERVGRCVVPAWYVLASTYHGGPVSGLPFLLLPCLFAALPFKRMPASCLPVSLPHIHCYRALVLRRL